MVSNGVRHFQFHDHFFGVFVNVVWDFISAVEDLVSCSCVSSLKVLPPMFWSLNQNVTHQMLVMKIGEF